MQLAEDDALPDATKNWSMVLQSTFQAQATVQQICHKKLLIKNTKQIMICSTERLMSWILVTLKCLLESKMKTLVWG